MERILEALHDYPSADTIAGRALEIVSEKEYIPLGKLGEELGENLDIPFRIVHSVVTRLFAARRILVGPAPNFTVRIRTSREDLLSENI